ncbi:MAG: N-formylglutamate amidohydrolase [Acetobacterales bacterium]
MNDSPPPGDAPAIAPVSRHGGAEAAGAPYALVAPAEQTAAVVVASPHSGRDYPPAFVAGSALDPLSLRKSEDGFVDELFACAPAEGVPLLAARFPRAFVDVNREPYELDPAMFADDLPDYVNTTSPRVAAGLGTIARIVANGESIYREKLPFAEAKRRAETCYEPYHAALAGLIGATVERFGHCILLDAHSMPSNAPCVAPGTAGDVASGRGPRDADAVLGDLHGTACAPAVTEAAERCLRRRGYRVARNAPYAGGYVTRHYGRPRTGVHVIQVELSRALYMDEQRLTRGAGFDAVAGDCRALLQVLRAVPPDLLTPKAAFARPRAG